MPVHAEPAHLSHLPDHYEARGVSLSRDTAHIVVAALRRDAFDMRSRGGEANDAAATEQEAISRAIANVLANT